MIRLLNKSNVDPASGAYPYGALRNNPGDNTGTPVNVELLSDVMQTVEKIMAEAGITPNDLPDNEANGWQIYDAMRALFAPPVEYTAVVYISSNIISTTSVFNTGLGTPTMSVSGNVSSLIFSSLNGVSANDVDISIEPRSIASQNPSACAIDIQYQPGNGSVSFAVLSATGTLLSSYEARVCIRKKS